MFQKFLNKNQKNQPKTPYNLSRERIVTTPKSGLYHLRTLETFFFLLQLHTQHLSFLVLQSPALPTHITVQMYLHLRFSQVLLDIFPPQIQGTLLFLSGTSPPKNEKKKVTPCLCKVVRRPCLFSHALVQVGSACHVSTREVLPSSRVADSIGKRNFEGLNNSGFYWPPSYGSSQAHFHFLWTGALQVLQAAPGSCRNRSLVCWWEVSGATPLRESTEDNLASQRSGNRFVGSPPTTSCFPKYCLFPLGNLELQSGICQAVGT